MKDARWLKFILHLSFFTFIMKINKQIKIIYSGGGTLGPVTPLLAMHEILTKEFGGGYSAVWVGTKQGIERDLVAASGIPFQTIAAGKLRRYFSVWNILDPLKMIVGFFQSIILLLRENPQLCVSAGGYVSVPLHWAAWLLGIPTWIHQQDVQIGLANRLMKLIARQITTVLKAQTTLFPKRKTLWLGNPIRLEILQGTKTDARKIFNLKSNLPIVFATGGGTGSLRINQLIIESIPQLRGSAQVIHLSGKERPQELVNRAQELFADYYQVHQFFGSEMKYAYAIADVVISRGGFGSLSELAALKKCVIVIPKPGHQEENVDYFARSNTVIQLDEQEIDGNSLAKVIRELLENSQRRESMGQQLHQLLPPADPAEIIKIVNKIVR